MRGAHAGHRRQILDRDGQAAERAIGDGRAAGAVEAEGGQGVDRAVDGGDSRLQRVEQLGGGGLARVEQRDDLGRGHVGQAHAPRPRQGIARQ
jgi:hypothetical protein